MNVIFDESENKTFYTEEQVISKLDFLFNNIYQIRRWIIFKQVVDFPIMGTNYAPLLNNIVLCVGSSFKHL